LFDPWSTGHLKRTEERESDVGRGAIHGER